MLAPKTQKKLEKRSPMGMLATLQAGIESKKNSRVRFGKYGGLKLEYFWVVKSKKAKSFIRSLFFIGLFPIFFSKIWSDKKDQKAKKS